MSIKKIVTALTISAASIGVIAGSTATPVHAQDVDRSSSERAAVNSFGSIIWLPPIRCVPIFVDWDTDEVVWICDFV